MTGKEIYSLVAELFPICRSLTGKGNRETLKILQQIIPLNIIEIPSHTKVFDWTIPREWEIKEAWIKDSQGNIIVDFKKNNLHVVGYSLPVNQYLELEDLQKYLFSDPNQPDAIPYVTSYYQERWGFCIEDNKRKGLKPGKYHCFIDSEIKTGSLTYGEIIIPGKTKKEIFLSTYICHPSMANDNLSGVAVTAYIAQWLLKEKRKYTYRIIFIPETIGAIAYLSKNIKQMKKNVIAGLNITCVGDENNYSMVTSRGEKTLADKAMQNTLKYICSNYKIYSYMDRGSDERQYCAPGVDLPVVCFMRSAYGLFPEYHTSMDNLDLVTPKGLSESFEVIKNFIETLESNKYYKINCLCEPQLGKRNLYPTISRVGTMDSSRNMMNFLAYCDGKHDLIDISDKINIPVWELKGIIEKLEKENLIK